MKILNIKDKLNEINTPLETITLGDFDAIGEFTAKKNRAPDNPLYSSAGCYFRPNYERGILVYNLIKRFEIKSVLEIGFGRGYTTFCASKAMSDLGYDGEIVTVDPNIENMQEFLKSLTNVFPRDWFERLQMFNGTSDQAFEQLKDKKFDLIYIDGDHREEVVRRDWENSKDKFNKFLLFDDYRMNDDAKDIEVRSVVDTIDMEKELIKMDRRIFFDDRGISDDDLSYGQVLIKNPDFDDSLYTSEW